MPPTTEGDPLLSTALLQELTTLEVEERIRSGRTTAIVVAGSTEQHGPHLPLFTDSLQAFAVGERLARRIDALLAPPITVGCSEHHIDFPGTITIPADLLVALVTEYCRSLAGAGFTRVVVLSTHGGNFKPLLDAEQEIQAAVGEGAEVLALCEVDPYLAALMSPAAEAGLRMSGLPHADASETSVILALRPDLVHEDRYAAGFMGEIPVQQIIGQGFSSVTPNGVLGDPSGASAEVGERCLTSVVDHLEAELARRIAAPRGA